MNASAPAEVPLAALQSPLTVLGFPITCTEDSLLDFERHAVDYATKTLGFISRLRHAQGEACILRAWGPTAKLRHLLRLTDSAELRSCLYEADIHTLASVERLVARPCPPGWERVAASPINSGGLGFQLLRDIDVRSRVSTSRESAAASVCQALLWETTGTAVHSLLSNLIQTLTSRPLPDAPSPPSNEPVARDDVDWLRPASAKAPHSSYFLLSAPGPYNTLSDEEFHDSIWFRLGLPAAAGHDECVPNPKDDPFGLHGLGCKAAAEARLRRHNALAGVIASFALKADPRAFQVEREVSGIADQTSRDKPGDVAMDLGYGRTLLDITVVNPFSAARLRASRSAGSPAIAAEEGYDKKVRKYALLLGADTDPTRCRFVPLSVTAAGGLSHCGTNGQSSGCASLLLYARHLLASTPVRLFRSSWRDCRWSSGEATQQCCVRAVRPIETFDAHEICELC